MPDVIAAVDAVESGETAWLEALRRAALQPGAGAVGMGDDAASVLFPGQRCVISTDNSVEGWHFRWDWSSPQAIGYKALVAALSDLAAMGAQPEGWLLSWVLPNTLDDAQVVGLVEGLGEASHVHNCPLWGGDTTRVADGRTVLAITVVGSMDQREPQGLRASALPGDQLWVTQPLGAEAAGLACLERGWQHHNDPTVQALIQAHQRPHIALETGRWLAAQPGVHAMMDLSDSLRSGAKALCRASHAGGCDVVWEANLPAAEKVVAFCRRFGGCPRALALDGAENYGLLVATDPAVSQDLIGQARLIGRQLLPVGRLVGGVVRDGFQEQVQVPC